MAELVLQVGPHPRYEDGDILCAFNDRRVSEVHCAHICSPRLNPELNPRTKAGFLTPATLAEDMLAASHRYKFVRVSTLEVMRIDLDTLDEVVFSNKPRDIDGKAQAIDVPLFIARRLRSPDHGLFGAEGAEYWFGGERPPQMDALDVLWSRIEAETPLTKADHTLWPLTDTERKIFLPVAVEDHSDEQSSALVAPLMTEAKDAESAPVELKRRAVSVDWKAKFGERPEILDKSAIADLRAEAAVLVTEAVAKPTEKAEARAIKGKF